MTPALNIIIRSGIDIEARSYRDAGRANGGSAPDSWFRAVSDFIRGGRSDGFYDSLLDVGFLCGWDNLNGALVKLKTPSGVSRILTNNNFVSVDYTPTGASAGLLGNGTSKWLETSSSILSFSAASFCMGSYETAFGAGGRIGSSYTPTGSTDRLYIAGIVSAQNYGVGSFFGNYSNAVTGHVFVGSTSSSASFAGKNGSVTASTSSNNGLGFLSGTFRIFRVGASDYGAQRLSFYHIGTGLTAAQVAALSTRVNALMATIGANQY